MGNFAGSTRGSTWRVTAEGKLDRRIEPRSGQRNTQKVKAMMSATPAPDHADHRKCSSCGKWKLFAAFDGRATCSACRTRKRLKGASLTVQRRETLGWLQHQNQQLSCQLTQTAKELTESNQEVAALIELLGKHAADALDTHTRLRKQRKQAAPAAATPNPTQQEILAETDNNLSAPTVTHVCNSEEIGSSAKHGAPHTSPLALFNHSPLPFTFGPSGEMQVAVVPRPAFIVLPTKEPCDSQGAQAPQLEHQIGTNLFMSDELFQLPLDGHSRSSILLPSSSPTPAS